MSPKQAIPPKVVLVSDIMILLTNTELYLN